MVAGSLCLAVSAVAGAATLAGTATIATPGSNAPLASGGSTAVFTVTLPAQAACSGDTANHGYHVYSYLVPQGTTITNLTFSGAGGPSAGYGFVDNTGTYYGPANTAITTGQVIGIPNNFEWGPLVSADSISASTLLYTGGTTGVWEAGIACATSAGALSDYWNTEVTFHSSNSDTNGFTWSAVPGVVTTTTTTTTTAPGSTTTTTAPGSTTTTTAPGSTTTTTAAGGTTTTTLGVGGTTTTTSGSGGTGSSDSGGSSDPGVAASSASGGSSGTGSSSTGGALAYTGFHTLKGLGLGLLGVGLGLMLLGWGYKKRIRPARLARNSPH
jgi:hypothetical protein